jgi:HK97 family phage prohead protease
MQMPDIQYRTAFDFRATGDDNPAGFEGYASTWWAADSYATAMAPGAFKKSIKERAERIPVLWNHDTNAPIGKHLALKEDKIGLYVNVGIADDGAEGSTFLARMRFGVPFGMSFGFQTVKDRSAADDDPIDLSQLPGVKASDVRVITEVKFWESSPVTFPANESAAITATRDRILTDHLSTLIESIRAGSLTDEQTAQIEALVSEWGQRSRAEAEATHFTPDRAKRDRDIEIIVATVKARGIGIGAY